MSAGVVPATRTWKESRDPEKGAKLDRIEEVTSRFPNRCFAFDQFGPLSIRPCHGSTWARESKPARLPATYTRTHGIRYFHGCYSLGDDQLWGVIRRRKHMSAHSQGEPGQRPSTKWSAMCVADVSQKSRSQGTGVRMILGQSTIRLSYRESQTVRGEFGLIISP